MPRGEPTPFTPGRPPSADLFQERPRELNQVSHILRDVANTGSMRTVFIRGEPGIGKTSFAQHVARHAGSQFGFVSTVHMAGGEQGIDQYVAHTLALAAAAHPRPLWSRVLQSLRSLKSADVKVFGTGVGAARMDAAASPVPTPSEYAKRLATFLKPPQGLCMVVDDMEGLSGNPSFAPWLKSLSDSIEASDLRLFLVLVGTPDTYAHLLATCPSFGRSVPALDIAPLADAAMRQIFIEGFRCRRVEYDEQAVNDLVGVSGGLPALAHLIGTETFLADDDLFISMEDAALGLTLAAPLIRERFLPPGAVERVLRLTDSTTISAFASAIRGELS